MKEFINKKVKVKTPHGPNVGKLTYDNHHWMWVITRDNGVPSYYFANEIHEISLVIPYTVEILEEV